MVIELTGMFLVDEIRLQGGGERAVSKGQGILGSGWKMQNKQIVVCGTFICPPVYLIKTI